MNALLNKAKMFLVKNKVACISGFSAAAGVLISLPASATSLDDMVSSSSSQFLATTGFGYADLVAKVGDWIKMFLGGGLGLVDALIGWIIALIIFGVIVSLIFRAMHFLHILR